MGTNDPTIDPTTNPTSNPTPKTTDPGGISTPTTVETIEPTIKPMTDNRDDTPSSATTMKPSSVPTTCFYLFLNQCIEETLHQCEYGKLITTVFDSIYNCHYALENYFSSQQQKQRRLLTIINKTEEINPCCSEINEPTTYGPTAEPTNIPSINPTEIETASPTQNPTLYPVQSLTVDPTESPTNNDNMIGPDVECNEWYCKLWIWIILWILLLCCFGFCMFCIWNSENKEYGAVATAAAVVTDDCTSSSDDDEEYKEEIKNVVCNIDAVSD